MASSKPKTRLLKSLSVLRSETLEQGYTVFVIEAVTSTGTLIVKRRYTEFLGLHKTLTESIQIPSLVFPGKHILKKKTPQLIEQRRKELEDYIQIVLSIRKAQKFLHSFLGILNSVKLQRPRERVLLGFNPCHLVQPSYLEEEHIDSSSTSKEIVSPLTRTFITTDIVVSGVLMALGHQCVTK